MAHRIAAVLASLAALLLMAAAPSSAAACCADIFRKTPVGWTTEGALLVRAYESSDCEGRSTAEIHSPGNFTPDSRFDLYDDGRRLRGRDEALLVNSWELDPDDDDLDVMPADLTHRFAEPIRGLCAGDVYVQAAPTPGEPADISPWDSRLQVTVSVMTDDGFAVLARDLEIHRMSGHEYTFSVVPSPDGVHAVLQVHLENSDAMGDELHWVRLPENTIPSGSARAGCGNGALAVPSTTVAPGPDPDEARYLLEDVVRWHADEAHTDGAAFRSSLLGSLLWYEPSNTTYRGYVVEALEEAGYDAVAREVSPDLPSGPRPSLADLVIEPSVPVELSPASVDSRSEDGGCYAVTSAKHGGDAGVGARPYSPTSCGGAPGPAKGQPLRGAAFPALFLTLGLGAVAARRRGR